MAAFNGNAHQGFWDQTSPKSFFVNGNDSRCVVSPMKTQRGLTEKLARTSPAIVSSTPGSAFSFSTPNKSKSFEFSGQSSSTPSFFESSADNDGTSMLNQSGQENMAGNNEHLNSSFQPYQFPAATNGFLAGNHSPETSPLKPETSLNYGGAKLKTNPFANTNGTTCFQPLQPTTPPSAFSFNTSSTSGSRSTSHRARRRISNPTKSSSSASNFSIPNNMEQDHKENEATADQIITNGESNLVTSFSELGVTNASHSTTPSTTKEEEIGNVIEVENQGSLVSLQSSIAQLKLLLHELDGVRALNDMRTVSMMVESLEKTVQSVRDTFKCDICFVPQYNYFYFCPDCGRMVGCFVCAYQIDRCSTCRKRLPTKKNRVPHFIPGLAASLDENEITRDELKRKIEKLSS